MAQKRTFSTLAIDDVNQFVFGSCPNPVTTKQGIVLGGGDVIPELNFTLPTMELTGDTIDKAYTIYRNIAHDALERASHLSQVGNISGAVADLWSNESIQYIRLLSDMAPTVHMEQLIYDCRLYNTRKDLADKLFYRDLLVDSDCYNDPQAWVLRPDVVIRIANEIVKESDPLLRTKAACAATIAELRRAIEEGNLEATRQDEKWLKRMDKSLAGIPDNAEEFWAKIKPSLDLDTFRAGDYLLD